MSEEKVDEVSIIPSEDTKKKLGMSWRNIGILCSAFSIIVLIGVASVSGWYLMNTNMHLAAIATQSQNQLRELQSDFIALKATTDSAQQAAQQSVTDVKELKQTMTDFTKESQGNQEKWMFIEARYYVKLANDNLQFSRPIPQVIFLLKNADQELSHVSNAKATEIRASIANDLATLQAVPLVDVAGLYLKLSALNNQLDQLPLQVMQSNIQQPTASSVEQNESVWRRGMHEVWKSLQNIVIVRHNTNGAMPLVTPEQKAFLYQNLHAMVAQSAWGLLNQQPVIYQASLQQLTEWIKHYFVLDAPATKAMLNDLSQLEKIDIHPTVPTLTTTLQAFNGV